MMRTIIAAGLGFLVAFSATFALRAEALPTNEIQRTYFTDNSFSTRTGGSRLACSGRYTEWGQQTQFYIESTLSCSPDDPFEPTCYACIDGLCSDWSCP